jgi:hypothetical protein
MSIRAQVQHGWLNAGQMMDGLALGETTPGPLIMVVAFVGFVGGYQHGGMAPGLAGTLAATLVTWFTFLPSFLFILAGGPLIESSHGKLSLTAPLTAITAAVVGVIANLALFFGWHALWPQGWQAGLTGKHPAGRGCGTGTAALQGGGDQGDCAAAVAAAGCCTTSRQAAQPGRQLANGCGIRGENTSSAACCQGSHCWDTSPSPDAPAAAHPVAGQTRTHRYASHRPGSGGASAGRFHSDCAFASHSAHAGRHPARFLPALRAAPSPAGIRCLHGCP